MTLQPDSENVFSSSSNLSIVTFSEVIPSNALCSYWERKTSDNRFDSSEISPALKNMDPNDIRLGMPTKSPSTIAKDLICDWKSNICPKFAKHAMKFAVQMMKVTVEKVSCMSFKTLNIRYRFFKNLICLVVERSFGVHRSTSEARFRKDL
ncbi:hypothetical protein HNY73_009698 [Argiope bruennichi]|uniref:Uncharacterized protein n=1 Tax=Argiope bruennichi TaxID=94029 RepID=A0A8T0FA86_ARGBR|nr:hypothetical protein HNY73_009698 [Argiope bruennichi]